MVLHSELSVESSELSLRNPLIFEVGFGALLRQAPGPRLHQAVATACRSLVAYTARHSMSVPSIAVGYFRSKVDPISNFSSTLPTAE